MKQPQTLLLNGPAIKRLVTMGEAMNAVEKAFKRFGQGKTQMPSKIYLHLDHLNGDFRAMPAYIEGYPGCCLKWVNVHPGNKRKGLPTVMALIILSDPRTGFPLCVMDGTYITALRTGAAGGVAAKYLARKKSRTVALVGCGVQAKTQLQALQVNFPVEQVHVWGRSSREAERFITGMKRMKGMRFIAVKTIRECVREADIVVTTTPVRQPLIKYAWLPKGVHINAIGADAKGKQELETRILKQAKVVVDAWEQAAHSGEINVPLRKKQLMRSDVHADIGQIVTRRKAGRERENEITVFDSTGLAIQDVAIANLVYQKTRGRRKETYMAFN